MKKVVSIWCLGIIFLSCSVGQKTFSGKSRLKIIAIDSTNDFYVFNTMKSVDTIIVVAEKGNMSMCRPFKEYIFEDSVHETAKLKSGTYYVWIGANEFTIDSIKLKKKGELAKIIWNCNCFTDK